MLNMRRLCLSSVLVMVTYLCAVVTSASPASPPTLRFASMYGSHMVLQAAPSKPNVWGFGVPGSKVSVSVAGGGGATAVYESPVDANSTWLVTLDPIEASCGSAYTITLSDGTNPTVTLDDVLFGDVILAGGQSNMQFSVSQAFNASNEIAAAGEFPCIRLFTAALNQSNTPEVDLLGVEQPWSVASPSAVGAKAWSYHSAVSWFFARDTFLVQKRPIGMLVSCWGGTPVEAWSSPSALAKCGLGEKKEKEVMETASSGKSVSKLEGPHESTVLWNAMIVPLLKTTIRGSIWYQGEADTANPTEANDYKCTFPTMIADWRSRFAEASLGTTDKMFPFGFVLLSTWSDSTNNTGGGNVPVVRYGQTAGYGYVPNPAQQNVFMSQGQDLGDPTSPFGDIHTRYKQQIAGRLALAGQAMMFGDSDVYWTGPLFQSATVAGIPVPANYTAVTVTFRNVGQGGIHVKSRDVGFELGWGGDGGPWAPGTVVSSTSDSVTFMAKIVAPSSSQSLTVRYEWRQAPCAPETGPYGCTVYSHENNLPAPPFNATVGAA